MKLTALKGISTVMSEKLKAAGIDSAEELTRLGSKVAFARIKRLYPRVCLVHLYTLQAAIDGVDIDLLPPYGKTRPQSVQRQFEVIPADLWKRVIHVFLGNMHLSGQAGQS